LNPVATAPGSVTTQFFGNRLPEFGLIADHTSTCLPKARSREYQIRQADDLN
jgi:hypothetical protein